jgi:Domain of unknown function (DUF4357)
MILPFSLRIFVADGDPDGLRIVERSNWVGRALVFPRAAWAQPSVADRPELQQTGVYLLLGPREDGEGDRLYIGEGDPIKPRLATHHSGTAQKDFWTRAICFVSMGQGLNKAHVQFLEANLIRLAKQAKRVPLDNANQPTEPTLSEADRADMQVFLQHMLGMLPVLGLHAFEQPPQAPAASAPELTCKGKGLLARGYESTQGFVVKAGSQAAGQAAPSMAEHLPSMLAKRQELIDLGVLGVEGSDYVFTQNYTFSSPSTAACVVLGRSSNGRKDWKDAQGRSLKSLQENEPA